MNDRDMKEIAETARKIAELQAKLIEVRVNDIRVWPQEDVARVERVETKAEIDRLSGKLSGLFSRLWQRVQDRTETPPEVAIGPRGCPRAVWPGTRLWWQGFSEGYGDDYELPFLKPLMVTRQDGSRGVVWITESELRRYARKKRRDRDRVWWWW